MNTIERRFSLNILSWRPIRALLEARGFPIALQFVSLLAVSFLLWNGWRIGMDKTSEELMTLRKTNLTTLAVWGLWWPAMIVGALVLGRAWCTVCPMELLNRVGHWLGGMLGVPRRSLGTWLRAGWFVVASYIVLQVLVAGANVHRVPNLTSLLLLTLGVLAFVTGLVFKHPRSFCKSFCPAKALLSVYGRFTPLQLDVRDPEICEGCAGRECIDPARRDRFDARSCPSFIAPFKRTPSDDCVLCLQCAKACPHENVGFGLVRPSAASRRPTVLKPHETGFVLVAAGFVAHEVIGEVKLLDAWFHRIPEWLNCFAPGITFGWFEAAWFLLLFPALLWTLTAGGAILMGYRGTLGRLFAAAATGAAPIIALAHVAKAGAKVSAWAGYLPGSIADPQGLDTLATYLGGASSPVPIIGLPLLGWVMLLLLVAIAWRNRGFLRDMAEEAMPAARAGAWAAGLLFIASLLAWPLA